jgi:putative FmdB family regulatory protein
MPTYEYRCPNGHTFELFQRMSDPSPSECQICGAAPVEKVLYPAAIHFKGSGFYSTDYGRGGRKKDGARDGEKPDSQAKDKGADKSLEKSSEKSSEGKKPAET